MSDLYERCAMCDGSLITKSPAMVDGLEGYTGPLPSGSPCLCTRSDTPGWIKTGLTSKQVERALQELREAQSYEWEVRAALDVPYDECLLVFVKELKLNQ